MFKERTQEHFFKRNRFLLSYGMLLAFLSSFGQSFLIALYVPSIQETFTLSDTAFSSIYASATILSAFTLSWVGRFIDKVNIIRFTLFVAAGLCLFLVVFSQVYYLFLLFTALFGLRLFGQGLMTHTSITVMARFFKDGRGKAMSIASLGHPIGEMLLPFIVVSAIYAIGWRHTVLLSAFLIVAFVPLLVYLLRYNTNFTQLRNYVPQRFTKEDEKQTNPLNILLSKAFWLVMPSSIVAGAFGTGFLLFKLKLGLANSWTPAFIALGFTAYSIGSALANLLAGFLTDRFSGRNMYVFYLLPAMCGFACLYFFNDPWVYVVLVGTIGITNGFGSTVKNIVLTELYGTKIIGSVRSLFTTVMVFSTAVGPFLFGILLDAGSTFGYIAGIGFASYLACSLNALRLFKSIV